MQAQPSLGVPLQLLSLPWTQVSALAGPTEPVQVPQLEVALLVATTQLCVPAVHGPWPSSPAWAPQAWVLPAAHWQTESIALLATPSQLLSFAEVQSRAPGMTAPTQDPQTPLAQVAVPGLQMPTAVGPQGWVWPVTQVQPSFTIPLQLASSPCTEQLSMAAGWTLQAPQVPAGVQLWVPLAQLPSAPAALHERVALALVQAHPSFGVPSHVLSAPGVQM